MTTNELQTRVELLSYDDLVEAANFYLSEAVNSSNLQAIERGLAQEIERRGRQYNELQERLSDVLADECSIDYLLRTVLNHAARGSDEDKRRLTDSLDGVGKSQVIVEVIYAIYAATMLGLVWLANPPREQRTKTTRETHSDGSQTETIETTVVEIPPPIDKLFGWIKGLRLGKKDN